MSISHLLLEMFYLIRERSLAGLPRPARIIKRLRRFKVHEISMSIDLSPSIFFSFPSRFSPLLLLLRSEILISQASEFLGEEMTFFGEGR